jgi:hypothetical protein
MTTAESAVLILLGIVVISFLAGCVIGYAFSKMGR